MKRLKNVRVIWALGATLFAFAATTACDSRQSGNIETEQRDDDNDPTRTSRDPNINTPNDRRMEVDSAANLGRRINVSAANFGSDQWNELKTTHSLEDDQPMEGAVHGGVVGGSAVSPIYSADNQDYNMVYSHHNDAVYVKMRVMDTQSQSPIDITNRRQAEELNFGHVWEDLERRAKVLEDSLGRGTR